MNDIPDDGNKLVSIMLNFQPVYEVVLTKLTPASTINFLEAIKINENGRKLKERIETSSRNYDWYYYYSCSRLQCLGNPLLGKEIPNLQDDHIPIKCLINYQRLQQYNPPKDEMNHEEVEIIFNYLIRFSQVHGRYKECKICHSPRVTSRAFTFLNYLENAGKKIFRYEFWNKVQKHIENGTLLDDEANLYNDVKVHGE